MCRTAYRSVFLFSALFDGLYQSQNQAKRLVFSLLGRQASLSLRLRLANGATMISGCWVTEYLVDYRPDSDEIKMPMLSLNRYDVLYKGTPRSC